MSHWDIKTHHVERKPRVTWGSTKEKNEAAESDRVVSKGWIFGLDHFCNAHSAQSC